MPEFKQSKGFQLKSGNKTPFKQMGASPTKQKLGSGEKVDTKAQIEAPEHEKVHEEKMKRKPARGGVIRDAGFIVKRTAEKHVKEKGLAPLTPLDPLPKTAEKTARLFADDKKLKKTRPKKWNPVTGQHEEKYWKSGESKPVNTPAGVKGPKIKRIKEKQ